MRAFLASFFSILVWRLSQLFDYDAFRKFMAEQSKQSKPEETADHHYWIEMSPKQLAALFLFVAGKDAELTTKETQALKEQLKSARRVEGPMLPDGRLDWDEIEAEAERQGVDIIDIWFDRVKQS